MTKPVFVDIPTGSEKGRWSLVFLPQLVRMLRAVHRAYAIYSREDGAVERMLRWPFLEACCQCHPILRSLAVNWWLGWESGQCGVSRVVSCCICLGHLVWWFVWLIVRVSCCMIFVGFGALADSVETRLRPATKEKKYSSRNLLHRRMLSLNPVYGDFVSGAKCGDAKFFHCRICKRDVKMGLHGAAEFVRNFGQKDTGRGTWRIAFTWSSPSTISWWSQWNCQQIKKLSIGPIHLSIWGLNSLTRKICCRSMQERIRRCPSWRSCPDFVVCCAVAGISRCYDACGGISWLPWASKSLCSLWDGVGGKLL